MSLVVFTGGARSGKSSAAEKLAVDRALAGARVVVAVFGGREDDEMLARIDRHRADRPRAFETLEVLDSTGWLDLAAPDALLLVDCLGTLLSRVMSEAWEEVAEGELLDAPAESLPDGFARAVERRFDPLIESIASRRGDTIVVTNEVGDGVVPVYATGRLFRDLLGRANRRLVGVADAAYLCVAGRLISLTGVPTSATWPSDT